MIGRGLRCWLIIYAKPLPLDSNAYFKRFKCQYSSFDRGGGSFLKDVYLLAHCPRIIVSVNSCSTNSLSLFSIPGFPNLRCRALYLMTLGSQAPGREGGWVSGGEGGVLSIRTLRLSKAE